MEARRNWLVGSALFLITLGLYWPATTFPFVNFDDPWYVTGNYEVAKGLSWHGVKWAAASMDPSNWHPLTLLSHMADCSAYGMFAGGHHLTNILFHAVNAVLLFLLLGRLTKWFWPAALVAALFAWHPMNVESVAWIAERKNVLSTFFFILTLWAYWRYVEASRSAKFYLYSLALILFALGLSAKSMLVTLPFLLLLLDGWPLRRISFGDGVRKLIRQRQTWLLVWEKIPFFILAIADCAITFLAQKQGGGVRTLAVEPLAYRLLNTPVAYVEYLVKTFWPVKLCVLYPFPETLPTTAAIVSLVLLSAATFLAWHGKNKFPWMLFGWLWFLGALVPVIGLVQVGAQAMADRYAYLPAIGLFLIAAGGLNAAWLVWPRLRVLMVTGVAAFLFFCLTLTGRQIFYWQDSVTLFQRVVSVYPEYALGHELLGTAYAANAQTAEAIAHYAQAVRLHPDVAGAQFDLGRALIQAGKFAEAEGTLAAALVQLPDNALLHNTRGVALMLAGKSDAAQKEFSRAIELQPDFANAYFNLGKVLLAAGQSQAASTRFDIALKLQPDLTERIAAELKTYQNASVQPSLVPGKN